jgi:hypothetical protein
MKPAKWLLCFLLFLSGCGSVQSFGVGPWPVYKEPDPLSFDDNDRAALESFAHDHPDLFKRIQGQALQYRAILREHNRRAKEMNLRQLKTIGFDEESIKQTLQSE